MYAGKSMDARAYSARTPSRSESGYESEWSMMSVVIESEHPRPCTGGAGERGARAEVACVDSQE